MKAIKKIDKEAINQKRIVLNSKIRAFKKFCVIVLIIALTAYGVFATLQVIHLENKLAGIFNGHKSEITNIQIESKLEEISHLTTCYYEYKNEKRITDIRKLPWLEWDIAGTENNVDIFYSGIIKAGFDLSKAHVDVNHTLGVIYITLPKVEVFDNYIRLDELIITADNNILNPINVGDMRDYFENIEQEELKNAEAKDLYQRAGEQAEAIITSFLAIYPDYKIVFI